MFNKTETEKSNFRYNLLTTIIYIVGIILLIQLFKLQIVNGKSYRETSNTRLSKEAVVEAARGKILDRTGTVLADTQMGFNVQLFKTKASEEEVNNSMIVLAEILEKNGDKYVDDFPISVNPFQYHFDSEEELNSWKEENDIALEASPEEAFYVMKDEYEITEEDVEKARKILGIRYTCLLYTSVEETAKELDIGVLTLQDIINELSKPGRDPREDMPKQILRSDVLKFEDLKEDMVLKGTVRNVTDFGAFVDIGVKHDGLVHISELSNQYVKNPSDIVAVGDVVDVRVIKSDQEKQKVALDV